MSTPVRHKERSAAQGQLTQIPSNFFEVYLSLLLHLQEEAFDGALVLHDSSDHPEEEHLL